MNWKVALTLSFYSIWVEKVNWGRKPILAFILQPCWRFNFNWTIKRNSILTSYISPNNLRWKVGIWVSTGWEVEQPWRTELLFKQWFPNDWPSVLVRQDWVVPEFLFQSQPLQDCNTHCSIVGIQTPAPQTKTTVSHISDELARSQQARHSLKMQEWTFPIIHKVLPCQHLQKILKLKGMAGFH